MIRRLDHVAIAVRDTEVALRHFRDVLGLVVIAVDEPPELPVRLTYLDAGNVSIQLIQPLSEQSPIHAWIEEHGEGLHHICFGVDDVAADLEAMSSNGPPGPLASGRGRLAGFLTETPSGVRIECTKFDYREDVEDLTGWLPGD